MNRKLRENHLISLGLSFLISKIGEMVPSILTNRVMAGEIRGNVVFFFNTL